MISHLKNIAQFFKQDGDAPSGDTADNATNSANTGDSSSTQADASFQDRSIDEAIRLRRSEASAAAGVISSSQHSPRLPTSSSSPTGPVVHSPDEVRIVEGMPPLETAESLALSSPGTNTATAPFLELKEVSC